MNERLIIICLYVCMYVCIYTHIYVCMYVCMYVCIYIYMFIYICYAAVICEAAEYALASLLHFFTAYFTAAYICTMPQ